MYLVRTPLPLVKCWWRAKNNNLDHTEKELRRHEPASRARGAHAALPSARGSRVLASLDDAAGAQAAPWLRVQLAAAGALLTLHEWHAEARLSRFLHGWRHQLFAELPETPAGRGGR